MKSNINTTKDTKTGVNIVNKHIRTLSNGMPTGVKVKMSGGDKGADFGIKKQVDAIGKQSFERNSSIPKHDKLRDEHPTELYKKQWNNQSRVNNSKNLVQERVEAIEAKLANSRFSDPNKIIEYGRKKGLTSLRDSDNPGSKKLFLYSEKLLGITKEGLGEKYKELKEKGSEAGRAVGKKSIELKGQVKELQAEIDSSEALCQFLTAITDSFPDIAYGSDYSRDLNRHGKETITKADAGSLALAITAYYHRMFNLPAFATHYFKGCSAKDRREFIEATKEFELAPLLQDIDLETLSNSLTKKELDEKIDALCKAVQAEALSLKIKHEQVIIALEKRIEQEESIEELRSKYDIESREYRDRIKELESTLDGKTQELGERVKEVEEEIKIKESVIKELSEKHHRVEHELKGKIVHLEGELQQEKTKVHELETEVTISKENYDQMKSKFDVISKEFDVKTDELISKTKELNLIKASKDELEKQLAAYENNNKTGVKMTVNKGLFTELQQEDSDDESKEDNVSSSKVPRAVGEIDKDGTTLVEDLAHLLKFDKDTTEFISTNNFAEGSRLNEGYTASLNGEHLESSFSDNS